MSASHGGGPQLKLPYIVAGVVLVFLLSYIGHYQWLNHDGHHFNPFGVLYTTVLMFFLHHASPEPHNALVLVAELLAMAMFLYGIFHFVGKGLRRTLLLRRIRRTFRGHTVLVGSGHVAARLAADFDAHHRKAIWLHTGEARVHTHFHSLVALEVADAKDALAELALGQAAHCIIAPETDEHGVHWLRKVHEYLTEHTGAAQPPVQVMLHTKGQHNTDLIKDFFNLNGHPDRYELELFNEHQLAAQRIYDQFAPHMFLPATVEAGQRIAVVGYNATTEQFLLENIILSHYPHRQPLTVYLLDEQADEAFHRFQYTYPFYKEYLDLVPVKQQNRNFFAHFTWSKDVIEKISKVSAVYVFGNDDAALLNTAASFRQFLYSQRQQLDAVPIIVCLPENTGVLALLDAETKHLTISETLRSRLHVYPFRQLAETCNGALLIDKKDVVNQMAKTINFYYSLRYEAAHFLKAPEAHAWVEQTAEFMLGLAGQPGTDALAGIESQVLQHLSGLSGRHVDDLRALVGADAMFARLTLRKRDSNRYAARHVAVKLHSLEQIDQALSPEKIRAAYPQLAPIEHTRWCAEKMVYNFRFAPFPDNKAEKNFLKDVLKIHDQLVGYDQLTEHEKHKDLNLFLLLPLLAGFGRQTLPSSPHKMVAA